MKRLGTSVKFRAITFLSFFWVFIIPFAILMLHVDYRWDVQSDYDIATRAVDFVCWLCYTLNVCCVALSTIAFAALLFLKPEKRFPGYVQALLWNLYPILVVAFFCTDKLPYFFAGPVWMLTKLFRP